MGNSVELIRDKSEKILSVAKNEKLNLIFGIGWMGTKLYEAFKALDIPIHGFVVSKRSEENQRYLGIRVYEKDSLKNGFAIDNIFIALRDMDKDLVTELTQYFSKVIEVIYPEGIASVAARFYINYLEEIVDLKQQIIDIKGVSIVNPFLKEYDYILSWVYEAGDLLLPAMFGDEKLIDEGPYEWGEVILKENDIVIDCGANIGLFSTVAAKKNCKIYAFEPLQEAVDYLREVEDLYKDNIKIVPYALSDENGETEFYVQNNDLLGASMFKGNNIVDHKYNVKVSTIDSFVSENKILKVDFIKADIEGAERKMLIGATETIKRDKPKLAICTYHLEDDKGVLERIIHEIEPRYIIKHKWKKLFAYINE